MASVTKNQKAVRRDPPPRTYDGAARWDVQNKDPERDYIWAHKYNSGGVEHYMQLGYEVELDRPDGPRAGSSRNPFRRNEKTANGESFIEQADMVLMSCPKEWNAERNAEGQRHWDIIEKKMVSTAAARELLKGLKITGRSGEPFIGIQNESATEAPYVTRDATAEE